MGRFREIATVTAVLLGVVAPGLPTPPAQAGELLPRVASALEAKDPAALARLFPADRKVRVSLDRIADLQGFVGSGPLIEALRRYLVSRVEVRFEPDPGGSSGEGSEGTRVRGILSSRDRAGRRERIGLVFDFETIDGVRLAVAVRETG